MVKEIDLIGQRYYIYVRTLSSLLIIHEATSLRLWAYSVTTENKCRLVDQSTALSFKLVAEAEEVNMCDSADVTRSASSSGYRQLQEHNHLHGFEPLLYNHGGS